MIKTPPLRKYEFNLLYYWYRTCTQFFKCSFSLLGCLLYCLSNFRIFFISYVSSQLLFHIFISFIFRCSKANGISFCAVFFFGPITEGIDNDRGLHLLCRIEIRLHHPCWVELRLYFLYFHFRCPDGNRTMYAILQVWLVDKNIKWLK